MSSTTDGSTGGDGSPFRYPDFRFGVATAGFQIEGGYNGPGEPANNWQAWEQVGRVEPSGSAVNFWDRPEEALDRAAGLGCDSFRLSVEWARVVPQPNEIDTSALERYVDIVGACVERGLEPLVTLHHFTHPAWLGEDFWTRPDAPERFRSWAELVVEALAPLVRLWVTINEINVLFAESWVLGAFPPGRHFAHDDAAIAASNLLASHVAGYEVIHRWRGDAVVTTNNGCSTLYELDRMLTDLLLARRMEIDRHDIFEWMSERRRQHDALWPAPSVGERLLRRYATQALLPPSRPGSRRGGGRRAEPFLGRAVDAVYACEHDSTLDVVGIDYYDPLASRHFRLPGRRTAGGRSGLPVRPLWDDVPDPAGLLHRLRVEQSLAPGLPLWVVENGLCNRVLNGRSLAPLDAWDRPRYLRENLAAVAAALDEGVRVEGYWHWSLVDNYEWGSYEPRFGLYGVDRSRDGRGVRWSEKDSMGDDAADSYRTIIAGLRNGSRSVLDRQPRRGVGPHGD